jgi:hypothetical protein
MEMVEGAMMDDHPVEVSQPSVKHAYERHLPPAAERALAEAAARRAEIDARAASLPPEHGARRVPEPVRYGDWETKGLASDF